MPQQIRTPDSVPDGFAQTVRDVFGDEGMSWLQQLPAIIDGCVRDWDIQVGPPFGLTYNYVAAARCADGSQAVLKLGFPGDEALRREVAALRLAGGRGTAQLLQADVDRGAILLEHLVPGTPLRNLVAADDEAATATAAQVMQQLWQPVPAGHLFPTVADWGRGFARHRAAFGGGSGPVPAARLAKAERLFAELCASMATRVVLHGDLHHDNILAAEREPWLAIDPKGLVGEPACEPAAVLRNPIELLALSNRKRMLARRIEVFAAVLGLERERIVAWGFAQAVLAAIWRIEVRDKNWKHWVSCADFLADV
jgi:streptomycin 6-kinase